MQITVKQLKKNDSFLWTDGLHWVVDEVILPRHMHNPNKGVMNDAPVIPEHLFVYQILAHSGMMNRRFYLKADRMVERK